MSDETKFLSRKTGGDREAQSVVCDTKDEAHDWLETQIKLDPMMDEYVVRQYGKTVYEPIDGGPNYGYVEEVPILECFEDPLERNAVTA